MKSYLLFQLYGPMASWGDIAVGEQRPTLGHPTKSAITGLLAAALGIKRQEEVIHNQLSDGYRLAIRVDASGSLLRDYHTIQVPPPQRGRVFHTRKDELDVEKHQLNTLLSSRDYRADAHYTVALWERNGPYNLPALKQALEQPHYTLYLGRKSCPLARPLQPRLIKSENLYNAFQQFEINDEVLNTQQLSASTPDSTTAYYWEELTPSETGLPQGGSHMMYERRDKVSSRRRWQFMTRKEYHITVTERES